MNIENSENLLKFINNEKKPFNNFNNNKTIDFFYKIYIKNILEMKNKFKKINNNKHIIFIGSNILYNVFISLLNYTNNLTLSIFLAERSILLYTEFIILSRDPDINKDLYYIPTISDAINFSYKKTIGPLNIKSFTFYKNNKIKNTCFLIKEIIQNIFLDQITNSQFEDKCDNIYKNIIRIYKLLDDKILSLVLKQIYYINNTKNSDNNIIKFIQKITSNITKKKIINIITLQKVQYN
jgi:hypothetical protein